MSIKAVFAEGTTAIVVHGLTQWDYGRQLEIYDETLPALLEVHFACPDMKGAIVRSCASIEGVATVAIPDKCLEQSAPVTAWVYVIEGNAGKTARTILMPVEARPRPQTTPSLPANVGNRYTELLEAINEQVDALRDGRIVAGKAMEADRDTFLHINSTIVDDPTGSGFEIACKLGGQPFLVTWQTMRGKRYCLGVVFWDGESETVTGACHEGRDAYYAKITPSHTDSGWAYGRVSMYQTDAEGSEMRISEEGTFLHLMPLTAGYN